MTASPTVAVVVPTIGRPSLSALLDSLANAHGPLPHRIVLVDDRPRRADPLVVGEVPEHLRDRIVVLPGRAAGPAAARNVGWRAVDVDWVAFLDDDVRVDPDWLAGLHRDISTAPADVAGIQGRIRVPPPAGGRAPTDWERNVAGLATARWATADMVYRRDVLAGARGFDERFPRAYREDADLGLRITAAGWRIIDGDRGVTHPVQPADGWVSLRKQAGNADDVLMRALHGRRWRERAGVPPGRRPRHLAVTAAALIGALALVRGRRGLAVAAGVAWAAGTTEFAWARIAPGPRTAGEVSTMVATSVAIPPAACLSWLRGWLDLPRLLRRRGVRPAAVLFDRDGTLVVDEPYNGDPEKVDPVPGALDALERLRAAGIPTAVVSNQSGVARGLLTMDEVRAVNDRIEQLLGPVGPWLVCPHGPDDACGCRKPAAGLVEQAAARLGVSPADCVLVGDIGSDVEAAAAAGARAVLVPTAVTRPEEVLAAPVVAADLATAVDLVLHGGL